MILPLDGIAAPPSDRLGTRATLGLCLTGQESARATPISSPKPLWTSPRVAEPSLPLRLTLPGVLRHSWVVSGGLRAVAQERKSSAPRKEPRSPAKPPQRAGGKMTAEVAVLNKMGVGLAADSAVTMEFKDREKIFTTANKIFTLSKVAPVGIMINGHVQHFGCPWEVIIKDFRSRLKDERFDDLDQYVERFLKTVIDPKFRSADAQAASVVLTSLSTYGELYRRIETGHGLRWRTNDIRATLDKMQHVAESRATLDGFDDVTPRRFNAEYGAIIDEVVDDDEYTDEKIPRVCKSLFKNVVRSAIMHEMSTQFSTGIVITGFGDENLFPKLVELTVDGGCLDKVRHFRASYHDVDKEPDGAVITAFAHDETVNSFLRGVDEKFSLFNAGLVTHFVQLVAREVLKEHTHFDAQERRVAETMIAKRLFDGFDDFQKELKGFSADEYEKPIREVLRTAPKETLAELAESLVSITSLRQRVSGEPETVGGPVDVAVISKGEGFIWIKRKHYFNKELNPHYVRNYFREVEHGKARGGNAD